MIWVIGNKGMLGKEVSLLFDEMGLAHVGTDQDHDITDISNLRKFSRGHKITHIVNCAAYTAVDTAEDEETLAHSINAVGAGNIAQCAREIGAKMIHISTDYVFSGGGKHPYSEDDPVDPVGAYGRTKAAGEELVQEKCPKHFTFRTSWLYGRYGNNFVYTMLMLMQKRSEIGIVADQRGSPTWTQNLAKAILKVVLDSSEEYGTYHFSDEGETNWYEFACTINKLGRKSRLIQHEVTVKALTTDQYRTKALRPAYSVLCKHKVRERLGCETPDWRESLEHFIMDLAVNGIPDEFKEMR